MFSDESRLLQLASPAFNDTRFILTDVKGTETLSSPFCFELQAFCDDDSINIKPLVGQPATLSIHGQQQDPRIFNGFFAQAAIGHKTAANQVIYYFKLVPWFWFLRFSKDHRRFENQTVPDIFKAVCERLGFTAFDLSQLSKDYAPVSYQVQYNETAFDFLNRILADAGIYYYFSHTENNHTLVLVDTFHQMAQANPISYSNADNLEIHIHDWQHQAIPTSDQVSSIAYDYETPNDNLSFSQQQQEETAILGQVGFESFSFPGNYQDIMGGEAKTWQSLAKTKSSKNSYSGAGNCLAFAAGLNFTLADHHDSNQNEQYLLLHVEHHAYDHTHIAKENGEQDLPQHYSNHFSCKQASLDLTPTTSHQPTQVSGHQSATIDGPVDTKLNAETLGRVKGRFYWQHDDDTLTSSHWLRVLQPIAGQNWGMQFLPRVGDEVIVRYLYGDPNQPIVIGSAHHAGYLPQYQLPNEQNKSGIVSRSVTSQNTDRSHQLLFDDTKTKEILRLVSSKDLIYSVKHNMAVKVQRDLSHQVAGDLTYNAGSTMSFHIKQCVQLNTGGGSILIEPDQIVIKGAKILLG